MMGRKVAIIGALAASLAASALLLPVAGAEVSQKRGVRVSLDGQLAPTKLPRSGGSPVAVTLAGRITPSGSATMPQLQELTIAINREGRLSDSGIPRCRKGHIEPSTTAEALAACAPALVGEGTFSAEVKLPEQSPFPSKGKILAFNGRYQGKPAVFAHIFGTEPVPTSYVLPFVIRRIKGTFGTSLTASLPRVTGDWGFVTGITIRLERRFTRRGNRGSYLTASCPAPAGFTRVVFPLMRASFNFEGGLSIGTTVTRSCRVRP